MTQRALPIVDEPVRPRTRGECAGAFRPCPWVSCRHHLMLDVTWTGRILQYSFDVENMKQTCALDVADAGGLTLDEIGVFYKVSREMIRQRIDRAFTTLRDRGVTADDIGGGVIDMASDMTSVDDEDEPEQAPKSSPPVELDDNDMTYDEMIDLLLSIRLRRIPIETNGEDGES